MNKTVIIIPSLEPDEKLVNLIENLTQAGLSEILLVDDGSGSDYQQIFDSVKEKYGCIVLRNAINMGKGSAIKHAFNTVLTEYPQYEYAITVDSDGQHTVNDILNVKKVLEKHGDALILGCRHFDDKSIPLRSRFGNKLTCRVLQLLCGIHISDTQTGLRGFSRKLMQHFLSVKGDRFEYEMNMLIETKELDIPVIEVNIETIYIEENQTSHFKPLRDSLRIYKIFGKFMLASCSSFILDILLFSLFVYLTKEKIVPYILVSTVGARIVSSLFNFMINKTKVFRNKSRSIWVPIKYYILCIIQMIVSAFFVSALYQLIPWNESGEKIIIDTLLFIISFQFQREWVFKTKNQKY